MRKASIAGLFTVVWIFLSAAAAHACHPWLNVNNYFTAPSTPIRFHVAYGHNYPFGHSFYDNGAIDKLYIINPKGQEEKAELRVLGKNKQSQTQFESTGDLMEGSYLVVMESKGNFGAFTKKGYQRKSKKDLKMVFVHHKLPHPDPELADKYSYQATLTFEVKP